MASLTKYSFVLLYLAGSILLSQNLENSFIKGIYSLQPVPGTKGHANGDVSEISDEILSAYIGRDSGRTIGINSVIPYRHWDRVNYPNWNYLGYVITYLKGIYNLTVDSSGTAGMQVLTPPLYSSFFKELSAGVLENDKGIDRILDTALVGNFIFELLNFEKELVLNKVGNDSSRALYILLNKFNRPLGGWYLDDEPFVRNHDVEILESLAGVIRKTEKDFFINESIFRNTSSEQLEKYFQNRFIVFDGDDLHDYKVSGRKEDGDNYNYNGETYWLSPFNRYTVLGEDTFDVLMVDFYHKDIDFWSKIINDIEFEYSNHHWKRPALIPVIYGLMQEGSIMSEYKYYSSNLIQSLLKHDIQGIYIYAWRATDRGKVVTKDLWSEPEVELRKIVESIK